MQLFVNIRRNGAVAFKRVFFAFSLTSLLWYCERRTARLVLMTMRMTAKRPQTRLPSNLRRDHPRMRAFNYACSLPVTRQRWRLHHSIRRTRKPHAASKHYDDALCLIEQELLPIEVLRCGIGIFNLSARCTNLTRNQWRYVACANMNFLRQGFRKLSSDRHTYTQTRPNYTPHRLAVLQWSISSREITPRAWCNLLRSNVKDASWASCSIGRDSDHLTMPSAPSHEINASFFEVKLHREQWRIFPAFRLGRFPRLQNVTKNNTVWVKKVAPP